MSQLKTETGNMEKSLTDFYGCCWIIVSGASRGLGAAICNGLAAVVKPGSTILGLARTEEGLNKTAESVQKINSRVKFIPGVIDFSTASSEEMIALLKSSLENGTSQSSVSHNRALIFHNAGSLGELNYLKSINSSQETNKYFQMNVSSVVILNSCFLQICDEKSMKNVNVINISSLSAVAPMKSWGLYCSGKAARDMIFKVLAIEQEDINVINYAPGPLDNEMQVSARESTGDPELRAMFASMKNEGKLLKESDSVEKLLRILCDSNYKCGDHVDYYDDL